MAPSPPEAAAASWTDGAHTWPVSGRAVPETAKNAAMIIRMIIAGAAAIPLTIAMYMYYSQIDHQQQWSNHQTATSDPDLESTRLK
jgi:hypothetical protein